MTPLAEAVIADLRSCCADLLAAGISPSGGVGHAAGASSITFARLFRQIDSLERLVPELLAALRTAEANGLEEVVRSSIPRGSSFPRHPGDWDRFGRLMVPRSWDRVVPVASTDTRPLPYILHVLQRLEEDFGAVHNRLGRHIEDARISRAGGSAFASAEASALGQFAVELASRVAKMQRIGFLLQQAAGGRLFANDRLPRPGPRGSTWAAFRRLADEVLNPQRVLGATLGQLFAESHPLADLPFLYQRWVGLKVLIELRESFGFQSVGDPIGALFLGGKVHLRRQDLSIHLWCEPRLGHQPHPCGLVVASHAGLGREATPDFVLVTPGTGGPDAFVLDATLSQDPTLIARKTSYRSRLVFQEFRAVAGVPGRRPPLRAWAAAPIAGTNLNRLLLPDGSAGVIPMQPGEYLAQPLRAWLSDLVEHAEAWHLLAQAEGPDRVVSAGQRN